MSAPADRPNSGPRRVVVQTLETLMHSGVTHLPRTRLAAEGSDAAAAAPESTATPPAAAAAIAPRAPIVAAPGDEPSATRSTAPSAAPAASDRTPSDRLQGADGDPAAALAVIQREVAACQRCAELAATRRQTVFGSGNPSPRLVFMGEAPGADEDRQGLPFVGRAGQLLTKIIEACTLRRDDVYILNTLKCRPPENRTPLPLEAANCREFLDRQIAVLKPEFICCLGAVAAQNLLGTTSSIGRLRGTLHDYRGIRVLCTYHPAYLLRNPAAKKDCWQDMQILMREMGISLPAGPEAS